MQPDDHQPSTHSAHTPLHEPDNAAHASASPAPPKEPQQHSSLFTIPKPLKDLFDRFPLQTYQPNRLSLAASRISTRPRTQHTLYIFTDPGAPPNGLSPNPTCLRYQTLFLLAGIPVRTASSNNHASPSGSLPFLIPANAAASKPVPASGLIAFIQSQHTDGKMELDAHQLHIALLEPIRRAYLAALYLDDTTFQNVCAPRYIDPSSRSNIVRAALMPPLRAAALDEITSSRNEAPSTEWVDLLRSWWTRGDVVDEEEVFGEAEEALDALGVLLGEARWFGNGREAASREQRRPGWMDASVFAYIHVVVSLFGDNALKTNVEGEFEGDSAGRVGALAERLYAMAVKHDNLMAHRRRILSMYEQCNN